MQSITEVVQNLKARWTEELRPDAIEKACCDAGMTWLKSLLNPVVTLQLFFLQILHGNTACEHLPQLAKLPFTAAAYCKARMRLKLDALRFLLERSAASAHRDVSDVARWLGHRVFYVDGSSFSMPDTPALQKFFGQPGGQAQGCGFPTAHWLAMMHAGSGRITKMLASPLRTHDMAKTVQLHPELQPGDVLVADRAFCSFSHLALLLQRGTHGLLRVHQRTIVDFTPQRPHADPRSGKSQCKKGLPRSRWLRSLGVTDQIVQWLKPVNSGRPRWMSREQFDALPVSIEVRELRYSINRKGFRTKQITLVTTLLDEQLYSLETLADLYRQRWEIETNFAHLKTTMKMDVLKCKTVDGVLKELHVFALIYNLVRQVMLSAATRQQVDVRRISFVSALRWLQTAEPGSTLTNLVVNPLRPNRLEPRVRKRRPKQYPLMKKSRKQLKKDLENK